MLRMQVHYTLFEHVPNKNAASKCSNFYRLHSMLYSFLNYCVTLGLETQ